MTTGLDPVMPAESSELSTREDFQQVDCRVVALTHYLPPYMARVLYHTARRVRDFRILLSVAQEPNRQFGPTWYGLNVEVQKSLMLTRRWRHRKGFEDELYVHFPYDTLSQLRRANPDIVFSYELGFRSLASALYCKLHRKRLALCVCVSEHTEQGRGMMRNLLRRMLLKKADAVTFNGPSCRRYLEQFGVPDDKLFHFPYCASDLLQVRGPLQRSPAAQRRLIYVGQLTQRKGVLPMIDALADYCRARPDRSLELELIGTGPLQPALLGRVLPANFRMNLAGHVPYDRLGDAMQDAGALIFPTLADEWGMVVNEALQAGLLVLGSEYAQACATLIREGENGWLYRPDRPEQLHAKLDQMYALSDERWLAMRRSAQQSVAHLTSSNVADKAVDMFRSLLTQPQHPSA